MTQKFLRCSEELYIFDGELKELDDLIQQCNINTSFLQKQSAIIYNNHFGYIKEAGYCKKNLR